MHVLGEVFSNILLNATQARSFIVMEVIQELWSGYGKILRVQLIDGSLDTVVVKHVRPPRGGDHPRGWNSNRSHLRKVRSYEVETAWYRDWSDRCEADCRVPKGLAFAQLDEATLMVLEELDGAGYSSRRHRANTKDIHACLHWLAHFHATFMHQEPTDLWPIGTYWHLDTRPDELAVLDDLPLKAAATAIDATLKRATYQTFVHGDAKLANFCFSDDGNQVAAVDFQYVGGGCGIKDLAYFLGSCLSEHACEERETPLLNTYFHALEEALSDRRPDIDTEAVISEWRELYPVAWTDFHRFLKGWSPGHWKLHSYSERLARDVVSGIQRQAERH